MPLNKENSIAYWGNSRIVCPYCDHEMEAENMDNNRLYEDGETGIYCDKCDSEVTVNVSVSFTYSTDEQDK